MTIQRYFILIILTGFLLGQTFAQETETTDFYAQIKNYDLSTILATDSLLTEDRENGKEKVKRAEILGFIGNNYQRFFIHFISIIQNPTHPYEYLVYGKTKVKESICSFQGTITIIQANTHINADFPDYKQGFATCKVMLYEDKKQSLAGFIKGTLKSNFIIDRQGQFRYDALNYDADDYSNNQFIGSWTSYKTNTTKKCNWGDYRIPECGDLDIGTGSFYVNSKYLQNDWKNYRLAYSYDPNNIEVQKARQKENEQWWK